MKTFEQWVESVNSQTTELYSAFSKALDVWYNGRETGSPPEHVSFTDEVVAKLGFNIKDLLKSGVIENSGHGGYQINKDVAATQGRLQEAPPVPYLPGSAERARQDLYAPLRVGPRPPAPLPPPARY